MAYQSLQSLGSVLLAPVLHFFCQQLDQATAPSQRLFFLAREGYWLEKAYQTYQDANQQEKQCDVSSDTALTTAVATHSSSDTSAYLLVSRAFLFKIGLLEPETYQYSLNFNYSGSLYQLMRTRFMISDVSINKAFSRKEQNKHIALPQDMDKVTKLLNQSLAPLSPIINQTKMAYQAYLTQLGYFDDARSHLVDIGYSGTIQTLLTLIFKQPTAGHYLIASQPGHHQIGNQTMTMAGYLKEGVKLGDGYLPLDRSMFLESLLTAPNGQFQDIRFNPLEHKEFDFYFGRKTSAQHHFYLLEQVFQGALQRLYQLQCDRVCFSQGEIEQLYTQFVTQQGLIPRTSWPLFSIDDDTANVGTVSPLDFFGLRL
ncbi:MULTISPECIES: hypothetical protein [unclassified Vibrio]|uniref:HAD family hydrolase n=1 Tax=Vibrio sp. HB236076 TaxID=3232307 RepID=A0AB39HBN9_9VIBR|nr:hypothetical protein [Vibrio sp. HB161653]MDP5255380.1 hypothetical protein [Vibrio sp. HB161653]